MIRMTALYPASTRPCPGCGALRSNFLRSYRGKCSWSSGLFLHECESCRLVFVDPLPSAEVLDEYNKSFFRNIGSGEEISASQEIFFSAMARVRWMQVRKYMDARRVVPRHVLEIGPGRGHFAKICLGEGRTESYAVIETDASCDLSLSQLGVRIFRNAAEVDGVGGKDLLVLSHVLEHVGDPFGFLEPYLEKLDPGGVVFIDVPCLDHSFKSQDEPHLLFFDKLSLGRLLQRSGLDEIALTYHGREHSKLQSKVSPSRFDLLGRARHALDRMHVSLTLTDQLSAAERAAIFPHEPHLVKKNPSWWLRALARKPVSTQKK